MICIYHSKDNDGLTSGAIVKYKYPDAKMIGWDYKDEIPDFEQFHKEEVIMIDVTFPIQQMIKLGNSCELTVIDHHISFKKQVDDLDANYYRPFKFIYEEGIAACEIGWKYLFPETKIPLAIELIGQYDTWRHYGTDAWENFILPLKYGILTILNSPEKFPIELFDYTQSTLLIELLSQGRAIMKYERMMDATLSKTYGFKREAYNLRALCLNKALFSSETMMSIYNEYEYDLAIGFVYTGKKWSVSLRSDKVDVSVIAKQRGGGGHKAAAGFEVDTFEKIFI